MTYTVDLKVKTLYNILKMFRRKGKGVKTLKVSKTQKKVFPVSDPTQSEHVFVLYFWIFCRRWNYSMNEITIIYFSIHALYKS